MTKPAPVTPLAPFEVIIATSSKLNCCPTSSGVLVVPNPRLTALVSTNDGGVQANLPSAVITPLTAQTLPFPLPMGWSPLQAFWIEAASAVNVTAKPWDAMAANDTAARERVEEAQQARFALGFTRQWMY